VFILSVYFPSRIYQQAKYKSIEAKIIKNVL